MPIGDNNICEQIRDALAANNILESETDEQHATKFVAKKGAAKATLQVFNTGKIVVQGKETDLRVWLQNLKDSILDGGSAPGALLPPEIERFPQTLKERVPSCDGVVLWFFTEALRCYRADSPAAAAFMLGAASEKLIYMLVDTYGSRITDETNRKKFQDRVATKMISKRFEEFKKSYAGSSPKPTGLAVTQDLEQYLEGAFNFYRCTRNQVGHPQIIPDLDKGVILANIGQFITYAERIYNLVAFFESKDITV